MTKEKNKYVIDVIAFFGYSNGVFRFAGSS